MKIRLIRMHHRRLLLTTVAQPAPFASGNPPLTAEQLDRLVAPVALYPDPLLSCNVFAGFQEDAMEIRDRHIIGVDNLLWGSDYPHVQQPRAQIGARQQRRIVDLLVDGVRIADHIGCNDCRYGKRRRL
jgi:hypothetical protein